MAYFQWADDRVIDNGPIDQDHRKLVEQVNALHTATTEGRGQEVRVSLRGDLLELLVLDRGGGFAQLPVDFLREDAGLGLAGLADRVESLGGQISFANRRDGPGAQLQMVLDLREAI